MKGRKPKKIFESPITHHGEGPSDVLLDRLDKSAVEFGVVLEPLYLGRGEVLLFVHFDLLQDLLRRTTHYLHGHHPGRDDPCRCADKMIELFDI